MARSRRGFTGFPTRLVVAVLVVLVWSSVLPAAGSEHEDDDSTAAEDVLPDPVEPFPLPIGNWEGSGFAFGTATASEQGVDIEWEGDIPAEFLFGIDDAGTATGIWRHRGEATQTLEGTVQGVSFSATGVLAYEGGGDIGGTNEELLLTGSSTTTGTVTAQTPQGSLSLPVDNTSTLPTLPLQVYATTCDEAYGEWVYTVEQGFEGVGFDASFFGYWSAFRNSAETAAEADALLDAAAAGDVDVGDQESQSPLLQVAAALLQEYNTFQGRFPAWTLAEVTDLATRTEEVLAILRNLSECEIRLFGEDNVETYVNGLTFIIQNLIIGTASLQLTSTEFQNLVNLALRVGALGPGAANPAAAVDAETALISAGSRILEDNVDPADGLILVNDDTRRVMAIGAAMGWTYTAGGTTYDARETYEYNFGEGSWQSEAGETGEDG